VGVLATLSSLWPFPDREILAAARKARVIVVPEMNYAGQLAGEILKLVGSPEMIRRVNRCNGTIIPPAEIAASLY
jgi:2-oxoglutarate ferredoxin oxidoreductase subunit alpha